MAYRSSRGNVNGGYEGNNYLEHQNDQMLDGLRDKIGNLKRVTIDIGEEARSQNKLLNDMGRDMDSSHGLLGATMKKLGIVSRARGGNVLCYLMGQGLFRGRNPDPECSSDDVEENQDQSEVVDANEPLHELNNSRQLISHANKVAFVFHTDSPKPVPVSSVKDGLVIINSPEYKSKNGRLVVENSEADAMEIFKQFRALCLNPDQQEAATDGYKSPFPRLLTSDLNVFAGYLRKADFENCKMLIDSNLNYVINLNIDRPTILHQGMRANAFHLAAKIGFVDFIKYIMQIVSDVRKLSDLYKFEHRESMTRTSNHLIVSFLTTPDKMGKTPLEIAQRAKQVKTANFLSSLMRCLDEDHPIDCPPSPVFYDLLNIADKENNN